MTMMRRRSSLEVVFTTMLLLALLEAASSFTSVVVQSQSKASSVLPLSLTSHPQDAAVVSNNSILDKQDEDVFTSNDSSIYYDPADAFGDAVDTTLDEWKETAQYSEADHSQQFTLDVSSVVELDTIICDIDGQPLSTEYLARVMNIDADQVTSYTCPEQDAFRGFMSNGCRIRLEPNGETAFYKHVAFRDLSHAQEKLKKDPFKLLRDIKSYQVVASFLSSQACQQLMATTGVKIPQCYDAQLQANDLAPMESKFTFLLEDLNPSDGWYQKWLIDDLAECHATLDSYAKLHPFFWSGSDFWTNPDNQQAQQEMEAGVWPSGSYVQPQAQNPNQCQMVAQEWNKKKWKFEAQLSSLDYWDTLGERLQSVAADCGRLAHPFATTDNQDESDLSQHYQQFRTFTHGDPKQANLFFRQNSNGKKNMEVGLIDFQWAGFGLAATDLAHFLMSAVHADLLEHGGEQELRQYYFDHLQQYLVEYGVYDDAEDAMRKYSYETFIEQYDTAVLDLCRLVIAYTWERFTEPVEKDDEAAKSRTMNKTSYNKSIPNAVWLMSRCDEILTRRGV